MGSIFQKINSLYPDPYFWEFTRKKNHLDIVNLGSTYSKHAFGTLDGKLKNFANCALPSQPLLYDKIILNSNIDMINPGAIIVIVVVAPCLLLYRYPDIGAEDKYYNILRKDEMPDYSSAKAKKIKNRRRVAKLIYLFRRVEAHKSIYDQYKKYASKEELFARAKWCNNGWCKLYGLKDLKSTNFTTKQKSDMEAATAELQAILTICQKQGFRPVIVVPPFAEALNQYFSKEFLQYVLIDNIDKANNVQAHVLNYQFRNEFQDDTTLFSDGCFLLNKKGSKMFLRILVNDMRKLSYEIPETLKGLIDG